MINERPSIITGGDKDASGKHSATFFTKDKVLDIYLLGYIAPDTYRHQLMLSSKDFTPGTTGLIANATAQFLWKD